MERTERRVRWLVLAIPLLVIPWLSGGKSAIGIFIDLALIALIAILLIRSGLAMPKVSTTGRWYLALLLWSLLSLIWSVNRFETIGWVINLFLVGATVVITRVMIVSPAVRRRLIMVYLAVGALVSTWGLALYIFDPYERLTGPFYLANPAAAFLLPAGLLAATRLNRSFSSYRVGLLGVIGAALILTDSRTMELTAVIAVGVMAIVFRSRLRRTLPRILAALLLMGGIVVGSNLVRAHLMHYTATVQPGSRFSEIGEGKSTSGSDRIYFLESAFLIWRDNPVIGTGAGTFGTVHPQYQQRVISASKYVHNFYAEVIAELGIVGALLMIGLILSILWSFRGRNQSRTQIVFSILSAAMLVHLGMDIDAAFPAIVLSFAILYAIWLSYEPIEPIMQLKFRRQYGLWMLAIAAAFAAGLTYSEVRAYNHHILAQSYSDDGNLIAAMKEEDQATNKILFNPDYLTQEGITAYVSAGALPPKQREERLKDALALAQRAERSDARDSQHYDLEGRVLLAQKEYPAAAVAFRTALRLDPYNHPEYAGNLASVLILEGRPQEAIGIIDPMLHQYPAAVIANRSADREVAVNLGNLYALKAGIARSEGDVSTAKAIVEAGLKINPKNLRLRALEHALGL